MQLLTERGLTGLLRSALGCPLDSVQMVGDMVAKLSSLIDNDFFPMEDTIKALQQRIPLPQVCEGEVSEPTLIMCYSYA